MNYADHPHAKWVADSVDYALNEDQARCVVVACSFVSGPHNMPLTGYGWTFPKTKDGLVLRIWKQLATYDGDELTTLVLAAHQHSVRVELGPCGTRSMELRLFARSSTGKSLWERHPTTEDLINSLLPADKEVTV